MEESKNILTVNITDNTKAITKKTENNELTFYYKNEKVLSMQFPDEDVVNESNIILKKIYDNDKLALFMYNLYNEKLI